MDLEDKEKSTNLETSFVREGLYLEMDNYKRPYFPGETLQGKVHLFFTTSQDFKYFSVKLEGKAEVHWTRKKSRKSSSGMKIYKKIHYRDVERYFIHRIKLLGSDNETESIVIIPPGSSAHPFTFTLPNNLPSSFKGLDNVGKVSYQIIARLKRSWFKPDFLVTIPFQVSGMLSDDSDDSPEVHYYMNKRRSWNCKRISASCQLITPQKFMVPGEDFPLILETNNFPRIQKVIITLFQRVSYKARRYVKHSIFKVYQVKADDGKTSLVMKTPQDIPPTKLGGNCGIIDVKYFLKVELRFTCFWNNFHWKVPIVVGAILFAN